MPMPVSQTNILKSLIILSLFWSHDITQQKKKLFELILAGPTPNFKQISNQQSTFECTLTYMYYITMKSQNF